MQNTLGACLLAASLSTCVGSSRRAPHPSKEVSPRVASPATHRLDVRRTAATMTAAETASREWAAGGACAVRLLRRAEIWQVASLLDLSFAANQAARSPITAALTRLRLALDVERRTTPWDWCRHQQFVVEDTSTGRLLGFAELWAENAAACGAAEAATPQPVVFNLCVAPAARRRGIARRLLSQCESAAQRWGEGGLFLKVEHDNAAALSLYRRLGYVTLDEREPAEMEASREPGAIRDQGREPTPEEREMGRATTHGPARPRTGWLSGRAAAAGSRCSARTSSRRARPSQSRRPAASPSCRSPSTRRAARRRPPERRDTRLTPRRARSSGADVRGRRRRRAGISLVRAAGAPQRGPPLAGLFDGRRRLGRPPRAADVCAVGGVGAPFLSQWGTSP